MERGQATSSLLVPTSRFEGRVVVIILDILAVLFLINYASKQVAGFTANTRSTVADVQEITRMIAKASEHKND